MAGQRRSKDRFRKGTAASYELTLLGIPEVSARTSILFVISVKPVKLQCKRNIGEDLE